MRSKTRDTISAGASDLTPESLDGQSSHHGSGGFRKAHANHASRPRMAFLDSLNLAAGNLAQRKETKEARPIASHSHWPSCSRHNSTCRAAAALLASKPHACYTIWELVHTSCETAVQAFSFFFLGFKARIAPRATMVPASMATKSGKRSAFSGTP